MELETAAARYLDGLLRADRQGCRAVLEELLRQGTSVRQIHRELIWRVMQELELLYQADRIDTITEHMATRINRTLVDQLQPRLQRREPNGMKMIVFCAAGEREELGAQMCADLFEADGWEVYFVGSGVPNDEIMQMVGRVRPDILLIYGTAPSGVPVVRQLIDMIRGVGVCPRMRIMVSGGTFNRAEGLWEEIGADLFAPTAFDALQQAARDVDEVVAERERRISARRKRRRGPASSRSFATQAAASD